MTAFNLEVLLLLFAAFVLGLAVGLWLRRSRRSAALGEVMVPVPSSLPPSRALSEPGEGAQPDERTMPGEASSALAPNGGAAAAPADPHASGAGEPAQKALPPLREPVADLFGHLLNVPLGAVEEELEPAPRKVASVEREKANHPGVRPPVLSEPEGGGADDLKLLKGIGPQNERRLHALGIFHFRQIAAWTPDEAAWVGSYLAFPGRIEREDWIGQARTLAAGEPQAPDKPDGEA